MELAAKKLNRSIIESIVLAFPNFNKNFIVRTDVSLCCASSVLAEKVNGFERPVAYVTRNVSEYVGILFALRRKKISKKFVQFVEGQEFILEPNNNALIWLHSMRDVNSKFQWIFKPIYSGSKNKNLEKKDRESQVRNVELKQQRAREALTGEECLARYSLSSTLRACDSLSFFLEVLMVLDPE